MLQEQNHDLSSRLDTVISEARTLETAVAELKVFNNELRRELSKSTTPSPYGHNQSGKCRTASFMCNSRLQEDTGQILLQSNAQ